MIVNQQGKPYSKRDGAAFVGEYREQGYLPEALFNYLLLLGWNPGDDREVLTREEMVKLFELEKVHVTAAMFDPKKLAWMNGEYIKKIPHEEFVEEVKRRAGSCAQSLNVADHDDAWWGYLADQLQVRTKFLNDIPAAVRCFVSDDFEFDPKAVEKRLKKPGAKDALIEVCGLFSKVDDWFAPTLEAVVKGLSQGNGMGPWVHPIRVAVSGRGEGIGLFEMLQLLGREKTLSRLAYAAENLCE